ncbi:hypothetical protein OIU13_15105 [Brevundimonas sp. BT-123]|uniref:hypothetical protein n=1 Tax=Brevundimonas sp. BT-123 TaxID=2986928 RepID=UPI0022356609|nr:hypothetical protein [Brevundimonas sp. BT-123]MCW0047850.1 hypothetical protein [Brevundimonas sp. BT-123]
MDLKFDLARLGLRLDGGRHGLRRAQLGGNASQETGFDSLGGDDFDAGFALKGGAADVTP